MTTDTGLVTMVTEFIGLGFAHKVNKKFTFFMILEQPYFYDDCEDFLGTRRSPKLYSYCNSGEASLRIALTLACDLKGRTEVRGTGWNLSLQLTEADLL